MLGNHTTRWPKHSKTFFKSFRLTSTSWVSVEAVVEAVEAVEVVAAVEAGPRTTEAADILNSFEILQEYFFENSGFPPTIPIGS